MSLISAFKKFLGVGKGDTPNHAIATDEDPWMWPNADYTSDPLAKERVDTPVIPVNKPTSKPPRTGTVSPSQRTPENPDVSEVDE